MKESSATYEVESVLFIRPDVVAVKVIQRPVWLDGRPIENAQQGSPMYVMSKEDGLWMLTACQNTLVLDD